MALKNGDCANFYTMLKAAQHGDLALVESKDAKTGEYRAVIAAVARDAATGEYLITPFGHLATGNPYEDYTGPTIE